MNKKDLTDPAHSQAGASQYDSMCATIAETGDPQLAVLVSEIRALLRPGTEEQLILTAPFADGASITDVDRHHKRNTSQVHGQFRRLMERIRKTLPEILVPYYAG